MATIKLAGPIPPAVSGPEHPSSTAAALVTAAELKRPLARPCTLGHTGTLRLQDGMLVFEGSDGRRRLETSLRDISDVVQHRSGYAFWARVAGKRYYVTPRHKPRPFRLGDLLSLRIMIALRMAYWDIGERRMAKELVGTWITLLTGTDAGQDTVGSFRGLRVRLGRLVALMVVCCSVGLSIYLLTP